MTYAAQRSGGASRTIPPRSKFIRVPSSLQNLVCHEHAARRVSDRKRWPRFQEGGLRCDAARPENGEFVFVDRHGVAVVRSADVRDADLFREADVNRRAMRTGELRRDLDRANRIGGPERSHRHDQRPREPASRYARDAGPKHRHVATKFDVSHGNSRVQQCRFK